MAKIPSAVFIYEKFKMGLTELNRREIDQVSNHFNLGYTYSNENDLEKIWAKLNDPTILNKGLEDHLIYINEKQTKKEYKLKDGEARELAEYMKNKYSFWKSIMVPFSETSALLDVKIDEKISSPRKISHSEFQLSWACITARKMSKRQRRMQIRETFQVLKPNTIDTMDIRITNKVKLSLVDPVSQCRIRTPVRSIHCTHLECFDLETFLKLERNPYYPLTCPVCDRRLGHTSVHSHPYHSLLFEGKNYDPIKPKEDLLVDPWVQSILCKFKSDVVEIDLATWRVQENMKKNQIICIIDSDSE